MNKARYFITPLVIVMMILGTFSIAIAAPPILPSSFYGTIQIQAGDGVPTSGVSTIEAYVPGVTPAVASAIITTSSGNLVYSINVPADVDTTTAKDGGVAGDLVTFKIGTRVVSTGTWSSGTNVLLNIHPPKAVTGGTYTGSVGNSVAITGSAVDAGSDATSYAWDLDNDGAYDDAATAATSKTWSATGVYPIGLKVTDAKGGIGTASTTVTISAGTATFSITNLSYTYDGSEKSATIVPTPSTVTYSVTYSGSETLPIAAGSYPIVVTSTDPNYTGSDSSKTLVIAKAATTTEVTGGNYIYDGSAHAALVTVTGANGLSLTPDASYTGSCSAAPITVAQGTSCTASYTYAETANYFGSTDSDNLIITKAPATVNITNLAQTYDTLAHPVTVTVDPSVDYVVTYNSSTTVPVDAGSYTVFAEVTDPNYHGNDTDTLEIAKAVPTITLNNMEQVYGSVIPVTATTVPSGLATTITYNGGSVLPTTPGSYAVVATVNTTNYAGTQSGTLVIHAKHDVALVPGWNLVSFNLNPTSTVITSVLSSVSGNYDLVYAWDSTTAVADEQWLKYDPSVGFGNSLDTLTPSQGFWIHMTATDTLEIVGDAPISTTIALNTTADGWNLVGYPAGSDGTLPGILTSNGVGATGYSLVYSYHAADTADPWKLYDRIGESYANDLTTMQPGWGYWIKVSSGQSWALPY